MSRTNIDIRLRLRRVCGICGNHLGVRGARRDGEICQHVDMEGLVPERGERTAEMEGLEDQ